MRDLGASDNARALLALRLGIADGTPAVRREAITALGMLGALATAAVAWLEPLQSDADPQIAARAAASLRAIHRAK
jgi:HEAT repeat protein